MFVQFHAPPSTWCSAMLRKLPERIPTGPVRLPARSSQSFLVPRRSCGWLSVERPPPNPVYLYHHLHLHYVKLSDYTCTAPPAKDAAGSQSAPGLPLIVDEPPPVQLQLHPSVPSALSWRTEE